jgi:hypothetical protein
MAFEEKKFCRISTLMERWDCSKDLIDDLVSKGKLRRWHPRGEPEKKGTRIDITSILEVELGGYI